VQANETKSNGTATPSLEMLTEEIRAQLATITGGLAPESYTQAWWDWYLGLSQSPTSQTNMALDLVAKAFDTWQYSMSAMTPEAPAAAPEDRRFAGAEWNTWPFNLYARAYKNWQDWSVSAINAVSGVDKHSQQLVGFSMEQILQSMAPSLYLLTNPELLERTRKESGQNLVRGYQHWVEDVSRVAAGERPSPGDTKFKVGEDVAATPGKVVLRNDLVELIQYSPQTPTVYAEPIFIVPAWIMKYYILDLSQTNSLVRYLVEKGHTVFILSWKNPGVADRGMGLDDYFDMGFSDALDAVTTIAGNKVHVVGYCIGGTLACIGTATLAAQGDKRIASLTLFAALSDFSEPGELSVFIDPAQLAALETVMRKKGFLDSEQMSGAFKMLRPYDLIWAPAVNNYVKGERDQPKEERRDDGSDEPVAEPQAAGRDESVEQHHDDDR